MFFTPKDVAVAQRNIRKVIYTQSLPFIESGGSNKVIILYFPSFF